MVYLESFRILPITGRVHQSPSLLTFTAHTILGGKVVVHGVVRRAHLHHDKAKILTKPGMMDYWHYTGDSSYNNVTYQALVSQLGPAYDFNMPSEVFDEGNDDQAFWVLAAMTATEYGFTNPPAPAPSWLQVCENAFNDYVMRWNTATCGGGLKWQFHPENAGYDYKNSISNGCFFQLAARLARFTGNQTYVTWVDKVWQWSTAIGLVDHMYNVYDGTDDTINCTSIDHDQWTYNLAVYLYGAAVMQNYTNSSSVWVQRTSGLLDATATFVSPFENSTNIIFEAKCELTSTCNVDQFSFKAYLARWLAGTSLLAPFTAGRIGLVLKASALGAANACTAGPYGNTCGGKWYLNEYDGTGGLGQQLSAMEVFYALLVNETAPPMTQSNVQIRTEPTSVSYMAPQPQPTQTAATARPLYGSDAAIEASDSAFLSLMVVLVSALTML